MRRSTIFNSLAVMLTALPAAAAVTPPPAKPAAAPATSVVPTSRAGPMTPQTIQLRQMTPAETEANAVWSLRSGLNVAALFCFYSPYLATRENYNDLLKHHSAELASAQRTMIAHFTRYDKALARNSFDQYSTKVYNSYSTVDAQYAFCNAASAISRGALLLSKGALGKYAIAQTPVLRASLTAAVASAGAFGIEPMPMPVITATP